MQRRGLSDMAPKRLHRSVWVALAVLYCMHLGGDKAIMALTWKQTWDSLTTYKKRDAVQYLGSSYISLVAENKGTVPGNPATTEGVIGSTCRACQWSLLAEKGATGSPGATGPPGPVGASGPMGPMGLAGSAGPTGPACSPGAGGTPSP